jgi:hypothetical protein
MAEPIPNANPQKTLVSDVSQLAALIIAALEKEAADLNEVRNISNTNKKFNEQKDSNVLYNEIIFVEEAIKKMKILRDQAYHREQKFEEFQIAEKLKTESAKREQDSFEAVDESFEAAMNMQKQLQETMQKLIEYKNQLEERLEMIKAEIRQLDISIARNKTRAHQLFDEIGRDLAKDNVDLSITHKGKTVTFKQADLINRMVSHFQQVRHNPQHSVKDLGKEMLKGAMGFVKDLLNDPALTAGELRQLTTNMAANVIKQFSNHPKGVEMMAHYAEAAKGERQREVLVADKQRTEKQIVNADQAIATSDRLEVDKTNVEESNTVLNNANSVDLRKFIVEANALLISGAENDNAALSMSAAASDSGPKDEVEDLEEQSFGDDDDEEPAPDDDAAPAPDDGFAAEPEPEEPVPLSSTQQMLRGLNIDPANMPEPSAPPAYEPPEPPSYSQSQNVPAIGPEPSAPPYEEHEEHAEEAANRPGRPNR